MLLNESNYPEIDLECKENTMQRLPDMTCRQCEATNPLVYTEPNNGSCLCLDCYADLI
mgnify:FL=1